MPLALALRADLDGVTDLVPFDSVESPYVFTFKVECTSCREVHPNWVDLTAHELHPLSGSRGEANFVWKCKACRRESSASFKPTSSAAAVTKVVTVPYTIDDSGKWKNVVDIETRGLEFVEFKPDGAWQCKSEANGAIFEDLDLTSDEWYDYDEKAAAEVSITNVSWEIRRA
ncbi:hypothetical protein V1514DRAFT_331796 [Lipomyces japonicus]|uniref:uncharacterized protein n=1 Tax=Lipomyces japonicus TaxID=56871 RepID=UPI0034CF55E4